MDRLLKFAGDHPVLTVIILLVVFSGVVDIITALSH